MTRRQRRYLRSLLGKYFRRIVVLDFEYEIEDGGMPNVLCLVVYILDGSSRLFEIIRRWRGEFGTSPPFDIDDDTLVVGYSLWAEMICFLVLGWRFPTYVYDLHTAYLSVSNILLPYNPDEKRIKQRKRIGSRRCRDAPRAPKATRSSSRRIRAHSPSRNGHRVRSMSYWRSRSRTPTSTTTVIPDCCA